MDIANEMKSLAADVMRPNPHDDMLQLVREVAAELTKAIGIPGLTFSLEILTNYNEGYLHYSFKMHSVSLNLEEKLFYIFIPCNKDTPVIIEINSPIIYKQRECKDIKDLQDTIVQFLNYREVKHLIWSAIFLSGSVL